MLKTRCHLNKYSILWKLFFYFLFEQVQQQQEAVEKTIRNGVFKPAELMVTPKSIPPVNPFLFSFVNYQNIKVFAVYSAAQIQAYIYILFFPLHKTPTTPGSFSRDLTQMLESQERELESRRSSMITMEVLLAELNAERSAKNEEILRLKVAFKDPFWWTSCF